MADVKSDVERLVGQLPNPDEKGMLSSIDKKAVDEITQALWAGGRDSVLALMDMLVEPGKGDDHKAHYAFHCLALHACGQQRPQRRQFTQIVAEQIGGNRPKAVRGYLIRELQFCGGRGAADVLGNALADADLVDDAAATLTAIGGRPAIEQLRAALPNAAGRVKLVILQSLCVLADAESAAAMKQALADEDREVRLTAAWGLANIADSGAVEPVLKAADTDAAYERIKATQACMVMAEKLAAKGDKTSATRIYKHLVQTRTGDGEACVRDAAKEALASLEV